MVQVVKTIGAKSCPCAFVDVGACVCSCTQWRR